jgi:peptidoglycan DL-endopeptidase CwlO
VGKLRPGGTWVSGGATARSDTAGRLAGRRRFTARRAAAVAAAIAVGGGVVFFSQAAGAAPKPTIEQVQKQVNALQAQIDQVGQQYVQVGQQVVAAKAQLASVQKQDGTAEALFTAAQSQLRQVAVASFENANQSSIAGLFTTGDPTTVLRQASLLEELGSTHSAQVAKFLGAAQQVAAARQRVANTEVGIQQLQTQLAAKKASLSKLLAASQAQLDSLSLQQQAAVAAAVIGGGSYVTSATYYGPTNTPAGKAVAFAYSKLGTWYLWGGTGPRYDCSGLVQAAWASAGVSIPRVTYAQYAALPHIPKSQLRAGDLVFFEGLGHVGMYVGNGLMIDAPETGKQVRLLPLDSSWYLQNYVGAGRPG